MFLHLLLAPGFCLWPALLSCALSCFHSHTDHEEPAHLQCFGGGVCGVVCADGCTAGHGVHPEETGWSKTRPLQNSARECFCALGLGYLQSCNLEGELLSPCREGSPALASRVCTSRGGEGGEVCSHRSAIPHPSPRTSLDGNPATGGGLGTPALAGGQLAVEQHHPFPAALLLQSPPRSVGLQEKGGISMHVPVPLGPTASRSHNSPFLCAVLMPLLFLISSHYVDLTSSAFPGQK